MANRKIKSGKKTRGPTKSLPTDKKGTRKCPKCREYVSSKMRWLGDHIESCEGLNWKKDTEIVPGGRPPRAGGGKAKVASRLRKHLATPKADSAAAALEVVKSVLPPKDSSSGSGYSLRVDEPPQRRAPNVTTLGDFFDWRKGGNGGVAVVRSGGLGLVDATRTVAGRGGQGGRGRGGYLSAVLKGLPGPLSTNQTSGRGRGRGTYASAVLRGLPSGRRVAVAIAVRGRGRGVRGRDEAGVYGGDARVGPGAISGRGGSATRGRNQAGVYGGGAARGRGGARFNRGRVSSWAARGRGGARFNGGRVSNWAARGRGGARFNGGRVWAVRGRGRGRGRATYVAVLLGKGRGGRP